jgi:uncharacterized C2H2 Zn-finger protein
MFKIFLNFSFFMFRLITMIIREAKEMLKCERCTVFLLDLKMYDQV